MNKRKGQKKRKRIWQELEIWMVNSNVPTKWGKFSGSVTLSRIVRGWTPLSCIRGENLQFLDRGTRCNRGTRCKANCCSAHDSSNDFMQGQGWIPTITAQGCTAHVGVFDGCLTPWSAYELLGGSEEDIVGDDASLQKSWGKVAVGKLSMAIALHGNSLCWEAGKHHISDKHIRFPWHCWQQVI